MKQNVIISPQYCEIKRFIQVQGKKCVYIFSSTHLPYPLILFRVARGPESMSAKQGTTQDGVPTYSRTHLHIVYSPMGDLVTPLTSACSRTVEGNQSPQRKVQGSSTNSRTIPCIIFLQCIKSNVIIKHQK